MSTGEIPAVKGTSRTTASRLKQERERHGWTQNQVAERIGTTQINISRWENGITVPGPYYRQKLGELFERNLEELGLFLEIENSSNKQLSGPIVSQARETIWNIPYRRNPFFTGREEILSYLYNVLISDKAAALTQAQAINGLGGVGKTQIAVEYAYRNRHHYDAMLWVTASSRDTFMADFVMLATLLHLPEQNERDQEIVVAAVKRWLTTHTSWLLILDNVNDLKSVTEFLPMYGGGNILLTTRLQALGSIAKSIEVEKMGMDEGVLLLLRRTKVLELDVDIVSGHGRGKHYHYYTQEEQFQAADIVSALDGLPLALDQAGAYIEETRCGFQGYLSLYGTRRKELLQRRGTLPTDHPESVAATWSLSFQQVEQISPAAADLLRLFAFLHPESIPEELIAEGAAELGPILGPIATDALKIDAALETLLRYSLIRRNPDTHVLSIHRLVQAVLKDRMDRQLQCIWADRTIRATNRAFPDVQATTWDQCWRCLPQVQISAAHIEEYGLAFPEAAHLLNRAATFLTIHAQYTQAEALLQQALAMRKQMLEPVHLDTALSMNDLGMLYLTQGKYQLAEPCLQQALAMREQVSGSEHADTATSLHNLALLYYYQGKYIRAEELYQQALRMRQHAYEPNHSDIAQSLDHLAELYTVQGIYPRAEELYLQALSMQKQVQGADHLDRAVAQTLNNLARLYRAQGAYANAESLYLQALDMQEKLLGSDHPDVAQTLNNLARLYRAQGAYAKAEPYYQRAQYIRESVFGADHPLVAESLYSLAKLSYSQGKYLQAEELCRQALQIQEQKLGTGHPDLAFTLVILARIYKVQHKYTQAEELYERALTIRESILGLDHPQVALILSSLAEVYQAQGKYLEAEPLITRSLAIREQSLGPEHPYVAYSLCNLAENYFSQENYTQAELRYKQALAIREHILGAAHPQTASTYHNLAKLYYALGRYQEAGSLYKEALAIREQTLGPEHPDVATSLEHYAALLRKTEQEELAWTFEARAKAIRTKQITFESS